MSLTYAQLGKEIENMSAEQKQANVTVYITGMDEFYPIRDVSYATSEVDALDENHPILNLNDED